MPDNRPEYPWYRRRHRRKYYPHHWYWYNWRDYHWYDWRSRGADQTSQQNVEVRNPYFKVDPSLMGNLLIYVSSNQSNPEQIEAILDNMIELAGDGWYKVLDMDDYEDVISNTGPEFPMPEPEPGPEE
jgi:hypothetical protein